MATDDAIQHDTSIADDNNDDDYVPEWLASFVEQANNTLEAAQRDFDRMADVKSNAYSSVNYNSICSEDIPSRQDDRDGEIEEPQDDMMTIPSLVEENMSRIQPSPTDTRGATKNKIDVSDRSKSSITFTPSRNNHLAVIDLLYSSPEMKDRYGPKVAPASVNLVEYSRDRVASQVPSITSDDISEGGDQNSCPEGCMLLFDDANTNAPTFDPPSIQFDNMFIDETDRTEEEVEIDFGMEQTAFDAVISDNSAARFQDTMAVSQSELGNSIKHFSDTRQRDAIDETNVQFSSQYLCETDIKQLIRQDVDSCIPASLSFAEEEQSIVFEITDSDQEDEFGNFSDNCGNLAFDEDVIDNATSASTSSGTQRRLTLTDINESKTMKKTIYSEQHSILSAESESKGEPSVVVNDNKKDTLDFFNNLLLQGSNRSCTPREPSPAKVKEVRKVESPKPLAKTAEKGLNSSISSPFIQIQTDMETLGDRAASEEITASLHHDVKRLRPLATASDPSAALPVDEPISNTISPLISHKPTTVDVVHGSNESPTPVEKDSSLAGKSPFPPAEERNKDTTTGRQNLPKESIAHDRSDSLSSPVVKEDLLQASQKATLSQELMLTHTYSESHDDHAAQMYDCARSTTTDISDISSRGSSQLMHERIFKNYNCHTKSTVIVTAGHKPNYKYALGQLQLDATDESQSSESIVTPRSRKFTAASAERLYKKGTVASKLKAGATKLTPLKSVITKEEGKKVVSKIDRGTNLSSKPNDHSIRDTATLNPSKITNNTAEKVPSKSQEKITISDPGDTQKTRLQTKKTAMAAVSKHQQRPSITSSVPKNSTQYNQKVGLSLTRQSATLAVTKRATALPQADPVGKGRSPRIAARLTSLFYNGVAQSEAHVSNTPAILHDSTFAKSSMDQPKVVSKMANRGPKSIAARASNLIKTEMDGQAKNPDSMKRKTMPSVGVKSGKAPQHSVRHDKQATNSLGKDAPSSSMGSSIPKSKTVEKNVVLPPRNSTTSISRLLRPTESSLNSVRYGDNVRSRTSRTRTEDSISSMNQKSLSDSTHDKSTIVSESTPKSSFKLQNWPGRLLSGATNGQSCKLEKVAPNPTRTVKSSIGLTTTEGQERAKARVRERLLKQKLLEENDAKLSADHAKRQPKLTAVEGRARAKERLQREKIQCVSSELEPISARTVSA